MNHERSLCLSGPLALGLTWAVWLFSAGCDSPGGEEVSSDSRDREVVENLRPVWSDGEGWRFDPQPSVVLPQEGNIFLFRLTGAFRLADGTMVVVDHGLMEVLFFDPGGRLVRKAGGRGEGPGEFTSISGAALAAGDTLTIWESSARRITRLAPDGSLISATRGPVELFPSGSEGSWVAPNGSVFVRHTLPGVDDSGESGPVRLTRFLSRIGPEEGIDTFRELPGREVLHMALPGMPAGLRYPVSTLFGPNTHLAAGGMPWRLVVGDGADASFEVWDEGGRLVRRVSWGVQRPSLSAGEVEEERARRMEEAVEMRQELQLEGIPLLPAPRLAPIYRRLFVDDLGHTWVERYPCAAVSEGTWTVFGPEGDWLGDVIFPPGAVRPLHIGQGFMVGLREDSLGVQTVGLYRFR
jgi:hypothetical protein